MEQSQASGFIHAGRDGEVFSTWWEGSKNWQPWFSIFPNDQMARLADPGNVITHLNNNERTGAYLTETQLTPATVGSTRFRKLYQRRVEGQVLAQPLYVKNVDVGAQRKNLFLVARRQTTFMRLTRTISIPPQARALWPGVICTTHLSAEHGKS